MKTQWFVYMLQTAAGLLYTGITTDPARRLDEHGGTTRGAKSLRGKGPLKLVFQMAVRDRSEASVIEARIKKLSRRDKERLVAGDQQVITRVRELKDMGEKGKKGKKGKKEKGEGQR